MQKTSLNNNYLDKIAQNAAPRVLNAIKSAAAKTGVNFSYLLEKAAAESSLKADAKSKSSSASGLFQFIESTWLKMVKKYGDKYGMGQYADCIDDKGCVADPNVKKEILSLRNDPEKASYMAAEFASENQKALQHNLGSDADIGSTELYIAHFMGAGGASEFLQQMKENPLQEAADLFPRAARANRNVFYDRDTGQPRTLAAIYDLFDKKFGGSSNDNGAIQTASADISATRLSRDTALQLLSLQDTQDASSAMRILSGANDDDSNNLNPPQEEERTASFSRPHRSRAHDSISQAAINGRPVVSPDLLILSQIQAPARREPHYNS